MISVEIYIGNTRLDLFKDEKISLNMAIKNFQNLDTVLTDFTQGFTIPASPTNNQVMEHWYNSDITTSFNPALKIEGRIELNTLPFRRGVFSLDKAVLKNGVIDYYEITFYGGTANLTQLFGEDFLTDLDLSAKKLAFTSFGSAIAGRVLSNDVLIPLISHSKPFNYRNPASEPDSIKYASGTSNDGGISYMDVKPAIKLGRIIDAIQTKYGITFNSAFFDSADFENLYMWAHREAGFSKNFQSDFDKFIPDTVTNTSTTPATSFTWDNTNKWFFAQDFAFSGITSVDYEVTVTPTSLGSTLAENVTYTVIAYDLNNNREEARYTASGVSTVTLSINTPAPAENDAHLIFAVKGEFEIEYFFNVRATYNIGNPSFVDIEIDNGINGAITSLDFFHFTDATFTDALTGETENVNGGLPQQKVRDFVGGLLRAFNLVIEPITSNEFNIETLDAYYALGSINDITKRIDISETSIQPAELFGQIDFKYQPTASILAENFRENNDGIGFGDLRSIITDSNGAPISSNKFEIQLPFINLLWSRLSNEAGNDQLTNILSAAMIDKNLKPIVEQPYLFYYVGSESITSFPIGTRQGFEGTLNSRTTYNFCYQWNTKTDSFTHSLNFGSEVNTYTLNDGTALTPSLYNDYWSDYITDLYDLGQRRYSMKAILPISILFGIKLNQLIVIGTSTYRINSMQVNLTTGEATLDLLKKIS
jgi:hypothetical protein